MQTPEEIAVRDFKKSNIEKGWSIMKDLKQEVYDFCEKTTGHAWTDWKVDGSLRVGGWWELKSRRCRYCDLEEFIHFKCPKCGKYTWKENEICWSCGEELEE